MDGSRCAARFPSFEMEVHAREERNNVTAAIYNYKEVIPYVDLDVLIFDIEEDNVSVCVRVCVCVYLQITKLYAISGSTERHLDA